LNVRPLTELERQGLNSLIDRKFGPTAQAYATGDDLVPDYLPPISARPRLHSAPKPACPLCGADVVFGRTENRRIILNPAETNGKFVYRKKPTGYWTQWSGSGPGHREHKCQTP